MRCSPLNRALAVQRKNMDTIEIEKYLKLLDGRGSDKEIEAARVLSSLGMDFPRLLLNKYLISKKWRERASCLYHASRYAISSSFAFELGIIALGDRSKVVRYEACLLLALAQNPEALKPLENLLTDDDSSEDARAAIEAIEQKNHHLFVDREHSGMVTLNVEQIHS